ncbi:MAG: FAD-binding oxidoreductase [Sphingomonadales bacterium]|nr:FAD-binding oxidoreductase [Sphingomonadales bacterium]
MPGPAGWNELVGAYPAPAQPLAGDTTADVVIIGAGFAGLSAARRLQQIEPTARIVVVEAQRLGQSSAGRNSGFMIDLPHELISDDYAGGGDDTALIALNRHAIAFARNMVEEFGIPPGCFDPAGKVNGAASAAADAGNRSYAQHLQSLGEGYELLDAQAMRELTGSAHYRAGLYTPGTVMLQPAGYIRGIGAGLQRNGITIHENSPVTEFAREGAAWRVRSAQGSVSTPRVILAVNGHLESFGVARGRLMQLFLFAVMTPELGPDDRARLGGAPRWGITPSDPMGTTVRRIDAGQGGHRIVTRTVSKLRPGMKASERDLAYAARVMQQKFEQRFPQFAGMRMQYGWAGHLCLTLNGVAVARQIDDGVWSGCVQNGLGTARGTLTGICAAELAAGQASAITRHFTAEPPPRRLPPQPFREIGANLFTRYGEWKARDE